MKTCKTVSLSFLALAAVGVASWSWTPAAVAAPQYTTDLIFVPPDGFQGVSITEITSIIDSLVFSYVGVSNALYGPNGVYLPASYVQSNTTAGTAGNAVLQVTPVGYYGEDICPAPGTWIARGVHTFGYWVGSPEVIYDSAFNP